MTKSSDKREDDEDEAREDLQVETAIAACQALRWAIHSKGFVLWLTGGDGRTADGKRMMTVLNCSLPFLSSVSSAAVLLETDLALISEHMQLVMALLESAKPQARTSIKTKELARV